MTVIKDDSERGGWAACIDIFQGTIGGEQPVHKGTGVGTDGEYGRSADFRQQFEAERLARLRRRGANIKIGRGEKTGVAPGVEAPEREQGELVIVAHQAAAEVRGNLIEHFRRLGRIVFRQRVDGSRSQAILFDLSHRDSVFSAGVFLEAGKHFQ